MPPPLTHHALPERLPAWGVLVLESHHSTQFTMDWRSHRFLKLVYVLSGHGTFHFSDERIDFQAADVFVVPAGHRNRIQDDPKSGVSLYVACLAKNVFHFDRECFQAFQRERLRGDAQLSHRIAAQMRRLVHSQRSAGPARAIAMVAESLRICRWIAEHQCQTDRRRERKASELRPDQTRMRDYVQTLRRSFYEVTDIDDAAGSLGMSRRTFTNLFANETGTTWLRYVRGLAISHACDLLQRSDLPISAIAFECGFNDLSTFYRQFKSAEGLPPKEFRSRHQRLQERRGINANARARN